MTIRRPPPGQRYPHTANVAITVVEAVDHLMDYWPFMDTAQHADMHDAIADSVERLHRLLTTIHCEAAEGAA
jgi:hypothetical protein